MFDTDKWLLVTKISVVQVTSGYIAIFGPNKSSIYGFVKMSLMKAFETRQNYAWFTWKKKIIFS